VLHGFEQQNLDESSGVHEARLDHVPRKSQRRRHATVQDGCVEPSGWSSRIYTTKVHLLRRTWSPMSGASPSTTRCVCGGWCCELHADRAADPSKPCLFLRVPPPEFADAACSLPDFQKVVFHRMVDIGRCPRCEYMEWKCASVPMRAASCLAGCPGQSPQAWDSPEASATRPIEQRQPLSSRMSSCTWCLSLNNVDPHVHDVHDVQR
jgi:hypothetical protein